MAYTLRKRARRMAINTYHALGVDKVFFKYGLGPFSGKMEEALVCFLTEEEQKDNQLVNCIREDIKSCYMKYLTTPQEYFLFGFKDNKSDAYRDSFLTDNVKIRSLIKVMGEKPFCEELTDKMGFYSLTKPYFKREVFNFKPATTYDEFKDFAIRVKSLFIKLLSSSWGIGAMSRDVDSEEQCKEIFNKLKESGKEWIVEQRIIQHKKTAVWNQSSVNTMRVPSFLHNGKFEIVQPFFRTGRAGAIIDNAGGGGILSCVDVQTGKLSSDGCDESGHLYHAHPDSGVVFKGWEVPDWEKLKKLVEEVHRSKMPHHRYIGWDFAYTDNGWVLIEGNWGQFVGQYANHIGVKDIFLNYMK